MTSLVAAGTAIVGAIIGWVSSRAAARESSRATVKAQQIEAEISNRRDLVADRDALLDRILPRLEDLEQTVAELMKARAADAAVQRAMREHVFALQRQIWAGDPPPPVDPPIPYP